MRALPLALLVVPALACAVRADDVAARAAVVAAIVYPDGATVAHEARATLPEGRHRLLIPWPAGAEPDDALPDVSVTGARVIGAALLPDAGVDRAALATPDEGRARDALEAAEAATRDARGDVARARAAVEAAETRIGWIATLTGGGEGAVPGPDDAAALTGLLDTLAGAVRDAVADRVAAEAEVDAARRTLAEAEAAEARARDALARLAPLADDAPVLALTVDGPGGAVAARLEAFEPAALWSPRYALALDTEAGTLALERRVEVAQKSASAWRGVALTLSTERPSGRTAPFDPEPDTARAVDILPGRADASLLRDFEAPLPQVAAEGAPVAEPEARGLSVSYDAPEPVTLAPGATALLSLDTLALPVETEIRAAPRLDATAYLVARATNPTAEPVLPGPAVLVRDGARVGEAWLDLVAPGAEAELGFGPVETIRLTWARLERGEGGAGVLRRDDTLREALAFEVENTGARARDVLALYALPVSEQESVDVDVDADPAPTLRDWRDRRGVAGWAMTLAPGETRRVEIAVSIAWPEGRVLDWRP